MFKKIFQYFFQYLHPRQIVETRQSRYNGEITLIREFGQLRISTNGFPQTGGIVQAILNQHLQHLGHPHTILLLGLGGGGIISVIRQKFLQSQLTAIEIDPQMITLAEKYFNIKNQPGLTIINNNAVAYLNQAAKQSQKFDAIIVDCFIGNSIPQEMETPAVIKNLSLLTRPDGTITINRLNAQSHQVSNHQLINTLQQHFAEVETHPVFSNLLIVARP